ncbi:type II secretion system protein [Patescibacteria group bacterium]|nr:type II secretion system protein [Patescibacteria group bacterium]
MEQAVSSEPMREDGYTLIEVLVVITLVALIAITATRLLFTSLAGAGKASALAVVKQNGDHAIGVVERAIRDARVADCPAPSSLILTDGNGVDTTYSIVSGRVASTIAVNVFLTSDRIVAESFSCVLTPGSSGSPDVVFVSFQLRLGDPSADRPSEVAVERFETRTTLRTY